MKLSRSYPIHLVLALFLLCGGSRAFAQAQLGGLQFDNASGNVSGGYNGRTDALEGSSHSVSYGLTGSLNSYYYNPNFFNMDVSGSYGHSQDNGQGSANLDTEQNFFINTQIFGGSENPGSFSFGEDWGRNGSYGVIGVPGLNSINNDRNFAIGWTLRTLPFVKNLALSFTDSVNHFEVPGLGLSADGATRGYGVSTGGYRLAGFTVGGGYSHGTYHGSSETPDSAVISGAGSSDAVSLLTSRNIHRGSLSINGFRTWSRSGDSSSGSSTVTDQVDGTVNTTVGRLPLSGNVNYDDNYYGMLVQQFLANGQIVENNITVPGIGILTASLSSSYGLPHGVFVTGYAGHQQEYVGGGSFGATSAGGNAAYGFGKWLKGLIITVGMHDSATQIGNTGASLTANATYHKYFGRWNYTGSAHYDQNVQTLFALTTQSDMSATSSVSRALSNGIRVNVSAGLARSVFSSNGNGLHSENLNGNLSWMKQTISGMYAQNSGSAIQTNVGIVPVGTPGVIPTEFQFSSKGYTVNYTNTLVKNLTLSLGWGRSMSSNSTAGPLSNFSGTSYNGYLTYHFRKVMFFASAYRSIQGATSQTVLPSNITVYTFGVSRWFKFF